MTLAKPYPAKVQSILSARPSFRMPLVQSGSATHNIFASDLPNKSSYAGLLLFVGDWEGAHSAAQDVRSIDGSYWHAIVHRQEPDPGNAAYWFRQVGDHPIFPALLEDARGILHRLPGTRMKLPSTWNPTHFIDLCQSAPGTPNEQLAIEIQHAEWSRLFEWCIRHPK